MQIFPIPNDGSPIAAFEVLNSRIGRRGACRIAESIPGVTVIKRPLLLSWLREETFCKFELNGLNFDISEPYGDSGYYWIGPAGLELEGVELLRVPEIDHIRAAFEHPSAAKLAAG